MSSSSEEKPNRNQKDKENDVQTEKTAVPKIPEQDQKGENVGAGHAQIGTRGSNQHSSCYDCIASAREFYPSYILN